MSSNRLQRAQFFADRGRTAEAIREYQALLAETSENETVHGLLAMRYADSGQFEPAMFHARQSVRCSPVSGFSHFAMGLVLYKSGQLALASDSLESAIRCNPENPPSFQLLASIRYAQGRRRDALHAIESCLRLAPDDVAALNPRASLLRMDGNEREAERVTKRALEVNPESSLAHVNLGLTFMGMGKHHKAIDEFHEALRLDPNCAAAHEMANVNFGLSFIAKGRYQKAFDEFDEALRLDPNSTAAQAGINRAKSARAITILYVFLALVGVFLAWVSTHGPSSGCTEFAVVFTLGFVVLLLRRHVWPVISRSP